MSHYLFDLNGKKALITGGGRGIGKTIAIGLASAGADIAITDIDMSNKIEIQEEIKKLGKKCVFVQSDITDFSTCKEIVMESSKKLGGLNILVNNAGTNIRKTVNEITEEDWDKVLDLNLKSYFFMTREAGNEMKKNNGGKVINLASLMGWSIFRNPNKQTYAPYASSKGGVISLTRSFAIDWAEDNIQVNSICPTFIETPLTSTLKDDQPVYDAICKRTPMGRFGKMEELIGPCIFLSSQASNLITGTSILVDGGWYAS